MSSNKFAKNIEHINLTDISKDILQYLGYNLIQFRNAAPAQIDNPEYLVRGQSFLLDRDLYALIEPYRPVIDGREFMDQPLNAFRDGEWQKSKRILLGTNIQEAEVAKFYIPELSKGAKAKEAFKVT